MSALVGAEVPQAALGQQGLDPGAVGALGKPEALRGPEAAPVRAQPGVDLKAPAGGGGDQRQDRVSGRRRQQRDISLARQPERREHVALEVLQAGQGAAIALGLGLRRQAQLRRATGSVALGGFEPVAAQERLHPLRHPRRLELVGEHRRHGDRQIAHPVQQRQVGAGHRVEQPLLAERIGPEALDVGHVRVEDDRQVADRLARVAIGARHGRRRGSRGPDRGRLGGDLEVGGRDRRDEAVVEGLREAKRAVDPVPAEPQRPLVDAQLPGVEDAEHLGAREVRLQERAVLGQGVLAQVPGVVGLLGAGRGERQPVGRRDVAQRRDGGEALQQPAGVGDVLDRLQEDDRVAGLGRTPPPARARSAGFASR